MNTTTVVTLADLASLVVAHKLATANNSAMNDQIAKLEQGKSLFLDEPEMLAGFEAKISKLKASTDYTDTTELEQSILSTINSLSDADKVTLALKGIRTGGTSTGNGGKRARIVTYLDGSTERFATKADIVRKYGDPDFDKNADGTKKAISAETLLTASFMAKAKIAKIEAETETGDSDTDDNDSE